MGLWAGEGEEEGREGLRVKHVNYVLKVLRPNLYPSSKFLGQGQMLTFISLSLAMFWIEQ